MALVEVYIDTGDRAQNKQLFDDLHLEKEEITRKFGADLEWLRLDEKQASRIIFYIKKVD